MNKHELWSSVLVICVFLLVVGVLVKEQTPMQETVIQVTNTSCNIDYSQIKAIVEDFEPIVVETTQVIESSVYDAFPLRKYRKCGHRAETYRVHGQSMHPLIADGIVMAEPVKWVDVEVGDVVEIVVEGENIFHALIYKGDDYAVSRGYNNPVNDAWVVLPEMVTKRYCVE